MLLLLLLLLPRCCCRRCLGRRGHLFDEADRLVGLVEGRVVAGCGGAAVCRRCLMLLLMMMFWRQAIFVGSGNGESAR